MDVLMVRGNRETKVSKEEIKELEKKGFKLVKKEKEGVKNVKSR